MYVSFVVLYEWQIVFWISLTIASNCIVCLLQYKCIISIVIVKKGKIYNKNTLYTLFNLAVMLEIKIWNRTTII